VFVTRATKLIVGQVLYFPIPLSVMRILTRVPQDLPSQWSKPDTLRHGPPTAMHLREYSSIANCTDFLMAGIEHQAKHGGRLSLNTFLSTDCCALHISMKYRIGLYRRTESALRYL